MRLGLLLGSLQRFKEEGDFTYWIRIPVCKGLKSLKYDPTLIYISVR